MNAARVSEPQLVGDGLTFVTIDSPALRGRGDFAVWTPQPSPSQPISGDLPVVLLLHGAYGSHWHWAFRGGAHLIARRLVEAGEIAPVALVMPSDGLRGPSTGYFPQRDADYETWIMRDVLAAARFLFPALGKRLFIAGYSMGGFGALRLGAKFAAEVGGVYAIAPAPHLDDLGPFLETDAGPPQPLHVEDADVLTWLRRAGQRLPPTYIACGRSDSLLPANRRLSATLASEGIAHTFIQEEGAHDFSFYSARLPEALRFFDGIDKGGRT